MKPPLAMSYENQKTPIVQYPYPPKSDLFFGGIAQRAFLFSALYIYIYTGIPRLTRFPIARFHLAWIFEPANYYLLVIPRLMPSKTALGKGFLKAKVGFALCEFHITRFFGCHAKRFSRGMTVYITYRTVVCLGTRMGTSKGQIFIVIALRKPIT